ncbi:hypothetical protein D3C81_1924380 [compost metagenome]
MLPRLQRHPPAHVQAAYALRAADFVGREAHVIHRKPAKCDRQHPKSLYSIDVEQDPPLSGQFPNLHNRLHRTNLIISKHHTDQNGIFPQGCFNIRSRD